MENVTVGKGNLNGKGVYAAKSFKKDEVVIKYNLKLLSGKELEELPEAEKDFVHSHFGKTYLYSIPERYVNHSEEPNTHQDFDVGCDIALRDIEDGEMITTNAKKDDIE